MMENPKLHAAVKRLSLKEKTLLSYIFEKRRLNVIYQKFIKLSSKACEKELIKL